MDPKSLSGLDPKLRETYERVMGTAASTSNSQNTPATNSTTNPMPTFDAMPSPAGSSIPPPTDTSSTVIDQPAQTGDLNTLQPTLTPTSSLTQTPTTYPPLPSPAQINQLPPQITNSTSPAIRILYIVAGIIFFIVYAIFWLKIFKFPLPF
jgi:hypothetical protein